jgi:hypothetical protein
VIYQLVLITNLGVITPLVTFPTFERCIMEKAKIAKTQQYSAECLPGQSPEQIQQNIETSMKIMLDTINKITKEQK